LQNRILLTSVSSGKNNNFPFFVKKLRLTMRNYLNFASSKLCQNYAETMSKQRQIALQN